MSKSTYIVKDIRITNAESELIGPQDSENQDLRVEIDEISELRRLVAEIIDPDPTSYTST